MKLCGSDLQRRRHRHSVRTTCRNVVFGYYAQYKYSQPFAVTVCGSKLQQRRHYHSVRTTVLKRALSVIMLGINTVSHLLKLCVVVNCSRGVTGPSGLSVIMLSINTASHLLKLCVVVNCSSGVTGTRSEQLDETWTFDYCTTGRSVTFLYCAQYLY